MLARVDLRTNFINLMRLPCCEQIFCFIATGRIFVRIISLSIICTRQGMKNKIKKTKKKKITTTDHRCNFHFAFANFQPYIYSAYTKRPFRLNCIQIVHVYNNRCSNSWFYWQSSFCFWFSFEIIPSHIRKLEQCNEKYKRIPIIIFGWFLCACKCIEFRLLQRILDIYVFISNSYMHEMDFVFQEKFSNFHLLVRLSQCFIYCLWRI